MRRDWCAANTGNLIALFDRMTQKTEKTTVPLRYWEIAETLREQIGNGHYRIGDRLPTEEQLCILFDASRHSLREALKALTEDGLISRRPRAGSVVIATNSVNQLTQTVASIQELLNYGTQTVRETIKTEYVTADHELAGRLKCPPGASWFHIQALRYAVGSVTPLCHTDIYILPIYAGVMRHKKHLLMPIADQIEEMYGQTAESTQVDIFASEINESIAKRLKVSAGSPGLTLVRRYVNSQGTVFEVAFGVHAAQRYTYSFHLKRERPAGARGKGAHLAAPNTASATRRAVKT
jgi:DNA-binding GntR family transcriptional regulator